MKNIYTFIVLLLISGLSFSDARADDTEEFDMLVTGMVSTSGNTIYICSGGMLTFTTDNNHIEWYNWDFGDGTIWYDSDALNPGWDPENTPVSHTFATAGTYSMVVTGETDDGDDMEPYQRTIVVLGSPTAIITGDASFCEGGSTTLSATSSTPGSGTITGYQWVLDGSYIGGANSPTYAANGAGNCTVKITNSNGCFAYSPITVVSEDANPTATVTGPTSFCSGSIITLSATLSTPGSGSITGYKWALDGTDIAGATATTYAATAGGNYTVRITNSNSCEITSTFYAVTENANPTATVSQTDVDCYGNASASVSVLGTGGTAPYMYDIGSGFQSSGDFTALAAGAYSVTVKDANSCTYVVTATITEPSALSGSVVSQTDVDCNGSASGSVSVLGTGGTAPYMYDIGSGFQSSGDFTALAAGAYSVTVKDAKACTYAVAVTITEPSALSGSVVSQTDVDCNGSASGSVSVLGSGGTAPYMYDIGSGVQSSGDFTALGAGAYSVTVKDAKACTYAVAVTITEPSALSGSVVSQTDVDCYGNANGSVSVLGSGGTGAYLYDIGSGFQSSGDFNDLAAGAYSITVKDANACTYAVAVTITEPSVLSGSVVSQTEVDCNGNASGSVSVLGTDGTAPYMYDIGSGFQSSGDFTALAAGSYSVMVKDANACTYAVAVTITEPSALSGSVVSQADVDCYGNASGLVSVVGAGGTGAYMYDIGSGFQSSGDFNALAAGDYSVTVKDANYCTYIVPATISEPAALTGSVVSQGDVDCYGNANGSVSVVGAGGTGAYMYDIGSGFQSSGDFTALAAGGYSVTVKDANSCTHAVALTIAEPDALTASIVNGDMLQVCPANGVQQLDIDIQGGNGGFVSTWTISPFLTVQSSTVALFDPQQAGLEHTYVVQVSDALGCTASDSIHIEAIPSTLTGVISIAGVPCTDCKAIEIEASLNPGQWFNIDSGYTQQNGTYTMTVQNFTDIILMAQPDNITHPGAVNFYYPATYKWSNAQVINTGCGLDITKDIDIPAPMNFNGITTLKGHIYHNLTGKAATEDDPIPLIDIVIEKTPPGAAQGMVTTDENGYFEFQHVPASDTVYSFYVNIPGLPLNNSYELLIGENDISYSSMDFCINLAITEIDTCSTVQLISAVQENTKPEMNVYPNPSGGDLTVSTGSFEATASDLRIMDLTGRMIRSSHYSQTPALINIEDMDMGYYFVQLTNEMGNAAKSFQVTK